MKNYVKPNTKFINAEVESLMVSYSDQQGSGDQLGKDNTPGSQENTKGAWDD